MAPETSFSMEDITSIWTLEMGFPVVFVKNVVGKTNQCHLRQQWFLADGSQKTADKKKVWQVPIMHFSKNNPKNNNFDPYFLNKPEVTIDVGKIQNKHANRFQPCGGLVNEERWSFFRVHYEADQMASIVQYMSDAENAHYKYEEYFSPTAKIGVVSDALAMGKSGYSDMTWSLKIIEVMRSERNPNVLRQISSVLGSFKGVLNDLSSTTNSSEYRAAYREFKKFAWAFVIDGVKELGFVNQPGEDDTRKRLRGVFLGFAAGYCANDPWVKEQAETQWEMFGQNRSSVSPRCAASRVHDQRREQGGARPEPTHRVALDLRRPQRAQRLLHIHGRGARRKPKKAGFGVWFLSSRAQPGLHQSFGECREIARRQHAHI